MKPDHCRRPRGSRPARDRGFFPPLASLLALVALALSAGLPVPVAHASEHAVAIRAQPKYPPGFSHFDYVDPDALKGGTVRLAAVRRTFDSFNPFILKGSAAAGIDQTFDTLAEGSLDEPNTAYGLVAERIEIAPDGGSVTFHLRPEARFHDGSPIRPEDVIWTFQTLKTKGHPFYRAYYASVREARKVGAAGVRFVFADGTNQELPAILGQLPVLSERYWSGREFARTTLEPPLGSGPYRVVRFEPGRFVEYERVKDYWARDLPLNRGRHNFDRLRYDYYRDDTVALEAFKAGEYDLRQENNSKLWATGYDSPALRAGLIRKELIPHRLPAGMQGFIYNTRRPVFRDRRVRAALAWAFDFEWTNKHLFYGQYRRSTSYFTNSELAATGLPSPEELAILEPYRGRIPEEVFTRPYEPPATDGSGNIRGNLRTALRMLREAGWEVRDGKLVEKRSGRPFEFEILLVSPAFERIVLPFRKNLERLGIEARIRTVDPAQYKQRLDRFDFDMVVGNFGITLSPGNEQRDFWKSDRADLPGSRNLAGVRDPVVDELVELVVSAPDRKTLIHRTRALDRVLLWGHYVIPNWYIDKFRVAYWDVFGRPAVKERLYGLGFDTWWIDPGRAERVRAERGRLRSR